MAEKSVDQASLAMLKKAASENIETVWDRYEKQQPQCGFGLMGLCCKNCNMGPCRIDPFGEGPTEGVCGATADTIAARNLIRMIAAGAAAHSDHGRDVVETLYATGKGEAQGYQIKDEAKLMALAAEFGIATEGKSKEEIAQALAREAMEEFGMVKGRLQFLKRAPVKRQELWAKLGIAPRGIDREVVESMHRTHIGVDNDYVSLTLHGIRTSLSDGWGGSMFGTEFSDILFGTPEPVRGKCNLGVFQADQVNIVVHGHEPTLSEMIVLAVKDESLLAAAKAKGANGINVCGMCCTGNELLMRHGVPVAGNFLQQELAIVTGAVELMVVDVQCVMPALSSVAKCYHTKVISTSPKAKFPGVEHVPLEMGNALETAKKIVMMAVNNYPNRKQELVQIPDQVMEYMGGFSVEAIVKALGGSLNPLLEAIKAGQIRGIVAVVGCNNPKIQHDYGHLALTKELIKNDVLVVQTGCAAIACAKDGLLLPEAAELAGPGLKSVCQAVGIPPVLHMGSCVDISRILVTASAIANTLGVDISDLPLAGAAPEWMSEKAVSIGAYVVGSGVFTVLGTVPPILGGKQFVDLLTRGAEGVVGAVFAVEPDPVKAAGLIMTHIEKKRKGLGL